jgi:hemolysin activation/secretion protein
MVLSGVVRALVIALMLGAAAVRPALGQQPEAAPAPLRFAIHGFKVENNTLLPQEVVDQVLAPFRGEGRDFGTVQQALEALEALYDTRGFSIVRVQLPEQVLERGEVVFRVVEGHIRQLRFEGQSHFDVDNIRNSLPSLKEGATPDVNDLTDNLRLINENPAKQVAVTMRSGDAEGDVIATVRTNDQAPGRVVLFLDNSGTENTGILRAGVAGQHANLFNRDHIVSAQIVTSPDYHAPDVLIGGLGYHAPIYSMDSSVDFYYGYSNVNSGTVPTAAGTYTISGKGTVMGVRFNKNLPKGKTLWDQRISLGFDSRNYQNDVRPVGGVLSLVPDILVYPLSLTYSASLRGTTSEFSAYLTYVHDILAGTDGVAQYFTRIRRGGSKDGADIFRYGMNWSHVLPADWQLRFNMSGQHTNAMLVTGEQFGVGGADSLRGMLEREVADDKGYRASLELYTSDWGKDYADDLRARGLLFADVGYLERIRPGPRERAETTASTVGFGVRGNWGKHFGFRLDLGVVLDKGDDNSRESRLHGAMTWQF